MKEQNLLRWTNVEERTKRITTKDSISKYIRYFVGRIFLGSNWKVLDYDNRISRMLQDNERLKKTKEAFHFISFIYHIQRGSPSAAAEFQVASHFTRN